MNHKPLSSSALFSSVGVARMYTPAADRKSFPSACGAATESAAELPDTGPAK